MSRVLDARPCCLLAASFGLLGLAKLIAPAPLHLYGLDLGSHVASLFGVVDLALALLLCSKTHRVPALSAATVVLIASFVNVLTNTTSCGCAGRLALSNHQMSVIIGVMLLLGAWAWCQPRGAFVVAERRQDGRV